MKVLIVKLGAIGDVVMAMPLLTHLHKKHPGVSITWVCGSQVEPLLKNTGLIDHLVAVDEKKLLQGSFFSKLRGLISVWASLFLHRFDLCLTAYVDPRYKLLSLTTRCKKRRSFFRDHKGLFPIPGRYHAYEYLRLANQDAEPLQLIPEFPNLDLPQSFFSKKPLIILSPGGAKNLLADDALRRWPIEHYATLIRLLQELPFEVVVTGAPTDVWISDHFADLNYTNLIGKLSLLELVALLKEARLLITHDSGPLHLGKLVNCPTIALFGPTNPCEKVSKDENITVLSGGQRLPCHPCYDGKTYAKCSRNRCLHSVTPDKVFDIAMGVLK